MINPSPRVALHPAYVTTRDELTTVLRTQILETSLLYSVWRGPENRIFAGP
jgi:hypothetical protein